MKRTFLSIIASALLIAIGSAFISIEKADIPKVMAEDYLHSVFNADLNERFETQFSDMFSEVDYVDVHKDRLGTYYYTVYGNDIAGELYVDFFKTTKQEVESETYNYIEMNSRTMAAKKCREAVVWPPPTGQFCHPNNPGYVCGVQIWPYGCFLY